MSQVFISYSRKDTKYASRLHRALEKNGIEVWRDVDDMPPGKPFPEETAKAIQKTDMMVLVWSESSCNSWFVNLEWNTAIAQKRAVLTVILGTSIPRPTALSALNSIRSKNARADASRIAAAISGIKQDERPVESFWGMHLKIIAFAGVALVFVVVIALIFPSDLYGVEPAHGRRFLHCLRLAPRPIRVGYSKEKEPAPPDHECSHRVVGSVYAQTSLENVLPLEGAIVSIEGLSCPRWPSRSHRLKTSGNGKFSLKFCPVNPRAVLVQVRSSNEDDDSISRVLNLEGSYGKTYVINRNEP